MNKVEFIQLDNEQDINNNDLDTFASSFDHDVPRLFPIWIAHLNGKLISFCHVRKQIMAYPAIHPSITPRQTYELGWLWLSKLKSEHGDPMILMPKDYPEKLLDKMGLERLDGNVYLIRD